MRPSQYLYRSRHGIYYFRVVMPKSLRLAHPTLPKELKSSLKCSNRVHAAAAARRMCLTWMALRTLLEAAMERPFTPGWTLIERERDYERIATTSPHDTPDTLRLLLEYLERTRTRVPSGTLIPDTTPTVGPSVTEAPPTPARVDPSGRLLMIAKQAPVAEQPTHG